MESETPMVERDKRYDPIFAALAAPFDPTEVRVRPQAGRQLHYITARTAMNRLDQVIGPANWWDDYTPGENSVICRLTVRLPDGQTITKADAGGYAGMPDSGDDDKSGFSDAFKRACSKFGVARYLYRDGVPDFVREAHGEVNDRQGAPSQARPAPTDGGNFRQHESDVNGHGDRPSKSYGDRTPQTGRALFAWTKEQEQRHEVGLLKYLNNWAKLQDFPGRMVDWTPAQVALGHAEAMRKLESIPGDAYEAALSN